MTSLPKISLMAARGRNGVIGCDGDIPWHLGSDFKLFKQATSGKPVIMGRKTWESLPRRPLPGRLNIVVTRSGDYSAEGGQVVSSLDQAFETAFEQARNNQVDEVFVIGGAQIYALAMPRADRLYLTEVDASPEGCVKFPSFDEINWTETRRDVYEAGPVDDHAFVFRVLSRKL